MEVFNKDALEKMYFVYKEGYEDIEGVPLQWEPYLGVPTTEDKILASTPAGVRYWALPGSVGTMIYPDAGIPLSLGPTGWGTSIVPAAGYLRYTGSAFEWTSSVIPVASPSVLGGVKISGGGLSIDVNGLLSVSSSSFAPFIHNLIDPTHHTVVGLTPGHFLKAITPTTYGFEAHGLTASSVGAIAKPVSSVDREILIWDGITGSALISPSKASISPIGTVTAEGDVVAFQSVSPTGSYWDNLPAATYNLDGHYGGLILDNNPTHFYNGVGNWVPVTSGTFDHTALLIILLLLLYQFVLP